MEKYEEVKDIGYGNYAAVKLIRNKETKALFAIKYISRGHKVLFLTFAIDSSCLVFFFVCIF